MLALMYAGEMCSWHWKLTHSVSQSDSTKSSSVSQSDSTKSSSVNQSDASIKSSSSHEDDTSQDTGSSSDTATQTCGHDVIFDSQTLGKHFLQIYIEAVKGPLRMAGWDCGNAETLLEQLGK